MSSLFPGVDPYLEASGDWPDFHSRFITHCSDALGDCLPRPYRARAQEFAMTMEIKEIWIEIVRHPGQQLVAVIEVLSPDNNRSDGADRYDNKRMEILAGPVHVIEIDLLIAGRRLPMRRPLPPAHYYAMVGDATRRPDCEVYRWTVRQPLPAIPIPLLAPDPPVLLELAAVYSLTYDRGRYARELDYSTPLAGSWSADDLDWIAKRVGAASDAAGGT